MAINIKFPSLEIDLLEVLKKQAGRMKFRGVGLFVGKESVDLVEMRRTFSGTRLVNFVSVPLGGAKKTLPEAPPVSPEAPPEPSPLMPSGEGGLSSHEQLLLAIRKAIRESGLRVRKVVSTLSEEEVIVRYFQMPPLPRKEWHQAIPFEARKYIPFTLEELISDFSVVEEKKGKAADKKRQEKMNVVFVAAKKEVVARHLALLTKADLQVVHLEALPFSFMRLLYALDPAIKKEKCICVVDVEGTSGSVILIKEGLPYLVRRISLEVSSEESVLPPEQASQEGVSPSSFMEKLLDEVRLTLRYYQNQFPGENVNQILLFGDSLKKDIPEMLTRELNLPARLEDLSHIAGGKGVVPLRLARTIGLGLRGLTGGDAEIELLPKKETAPSRQTRLFKISLLEGLGAVAALLSLFFILSHSVDIQKKILEKERGKQALVTLLSKADLEAKRTTLSQKANLYRDLVGKRLLWTKKLSQLGSVLPQGAWITSLRAEDRSDQAKPVEVGLYDYRLLLKGFVYVPDKEEELKVPSQFLTAIQQDAGFFEGFTEAKIVSVTRDVVEEVGVTSFEILLTGER